MKDACKVSKDNNKKTGRSSSFCVHFDDFGEILCTRDFVNLPFTTQVDLNEHGKDNADDQQQQGTKVKILLVLLNRYSWYRNLRHFWRRDGGNRGRQGGELGLLSN